MRFEMPERNPEAERFERLVKAAAELAPTFDLKRYPNKHVHVALDREGIKDAEERERLVPEIKKALHRRKPVPFSKRDDLIEDARIQEMRHPKDDEDEA